MYKYSGQDWKKFDNQDSQGISSQESIRVISFNVLHDMDRNHIMLPKVRYSYQLKKLQELNPNIIGLCEITPNYLKFIQSNKWIQENFFMSDLTGETISSDLNSNIGSFHGCLLLSKFPMNITTQKIKTLDRFIVIGDITTSEKKSIGIAMCHTTAFQGNYLRRQGQLREIFETMDSFGFATSIVMGDLNLHYEFEDEYIRDDYLDTWKLCSQEKGYTYDAEKNLMIYEKLPLAFEWRKMRLDRILIKSKSVLTKSVKIIFDEPIFGSDSNKTSASDWIYYIRWPLRSITSTLVDWTLYSNIWRDPHEYLFPSDHFGLMADFDVSDLIVKLE